MSCIFKMKEARTSMTSTEQKIADYILDHKEETINASAQVLANQTQSSPAALIRFSKKLGYKGFTALKVDLAKENSVQEEDFDDLIREQDSIGTVIKKAHLTNRQTIEQTYKLINPQALEKAVEAILKCKNLYLFGVGGSGVVCNDFLHKLSRINRSVIHHDDTHVMVARAAHMTHEDVALAISYSGETRDVNAAMRYANEVGAMTIAITQFNPKSTLSKLAEIVLHIPSEEKALRLGAIASRNSSLILTDLIYYGIAKNALTITKKDLVMTRELIKEIKE